MQTESARTDWRVFSCEVIGTAVHADNGAGLGASHQTGLTGLVAKLIELYGVLDPKRALEVGKKAAFERGA
jgi:hypothetical protein